MYCNFTRSPSFPLALIRVSSKPTCFQSQCFSIGFHPKPSLNPNLINFTTPSSSYFVQSLRYSTDWQCKTRKLVGVSKPISIPGGFRRKSTVRNASVLRVRSLSGAYSRKVAEGNGGRRGEKPLPWLAAQKDRVSKRSEKPANVETGLSSWGESVKRFEKAVVTESVGSSWKESEERLLKVEATKTFRTSWDEAAKRAQEVNARSSMEVKEDRKVWYKQGNGHIERSERVEDREEGEAIDDPRWDRIRNRAEGFRNRNGRDGGNSRYEKPEVQRWNNQESWGKKTWKEASESTVPKMVGECVYGVGPVLAALSAGRREFYVLYVQEGLELSTNNRKKKDKKGFEKVLGIAEKIGLSLREIPKHDLNMIVDNRPHQGLVLDASPLDMIGIKDLEPVSSEEENGSLWVALDEVTDPQNLGAIIRSAYYFGASGVVLCAKNSAPLSGVVSKASAGSLELMELRSCKNMMQFLSSSIENGWRVLGGSVSSRAIPLNQILPGAPTILVLGSEGTGLRPLVERSCTELIRIPGNIPVEVSAGEVEKVDSGEEFRSFMAVESLNVSVAAGVLLHHLIGKYNSEGQSGDDQTESL